MRLRIQHRNHQPSASFTALIRENLEALGEDLTIDEARVLIEHRLEASPAFRVAAHLVTPGPDVEAEAADHTARAALHKAIAQLAAHIVHLRAKRERRSQSERRPAQAAPACVRG